MKLSGFLNKPRWQSKEAAVRRAGVAEDDDAELLSTLSSIARQDADASVRATAMKRLADPGLTQRLATEDPDAGVRTEARKLWLDLLAGTLRLFGEPLHYADAFLSLFAVGVLLAAVRAVTGNIAASMGLHAGWVWVITFMREGSQPNDAHPLRFLTSQFDGVVGWLVLAWTILIGVVIYRLYAKSGRTLRDRPAG